MVPEAVGVSNVRIDGVYNFESPGVSEEKKASAKTPRHAREAKGAAGDAEVLSSMLPLIRKAADVEEVDAQAVQAARQLLQSDQLDTPEAARRAAEAILGGGI